MKSQRKNSIYFATFCWFYVFLSYVLNPVQFRSLGINCCCCCFTFLWGSIKQYQ